MRYLVIGQGGREHAIVRALSLSPSVSEVHACPGNPGMQAQALCHPLDWRDDEGLRQFIKQRAIDVVIIGPEDPLCDGLADRLRSVGVQVVGPSKAAAQLEGSKVFAKSFMKRAGVPTASYSEVSSLDEVMPLVDQYQAPYVLKADGLAAGKGVYICPDRSALEAAATEIFVDQRFGEAGSKALLEAFLPGEELSFFVLTNGREFRALPMARDYKRLLDQGKGPNTGGMGAVAPMTVDPALETQIIETVVRPTVEQLAHEQLDYRGILYIGLMVQQGQPRVLEYNVRLGDPEAQVLLPLIDVDWGKVFSQLAFGELSELPVKPLHSCAVVLAAEGYPVAPKKGVAIEGNPLHDTASSYFLHAGTARKGGDWMVNGGRVLNGIGLGSDASEARQHAYSQIENAHWLGRQHRSDIGEG